VVTTVTVANSQFYGNLYGVAGSNVSSIGTISVTKSTFDAVEYGVFYGTHFSFL
jgi:hypothetical protein